MPVFHMPYHYRRLKIFCFLPTNALQQGTHNPILQKTETCAEYMRPCRQFRLPVQRHQIVQWTYLPYLPGSIRFRSDIPYHLLLGACIYFCFWRRRKS